MSRVVDVYISVDVEADGPLPGPHSMSSFGASVAGLLSDDGEFVRLDPTADTFYAELRPISDDWVPAAMAVSGLDRDELVRTGRDPGQAMTEFAGWVRDQGRRHGGRAVFCAYPLGFDWLFTYWYLVQFADGGSPFGHSSHLDMKTAYAVRGGQPIARSVKRRMPRSLLSKRKHTHNALDDAIEQADLLANLLSWDGQLPAADSFDSGC